LGVLATFADVSCCVCKRIAWFGRGVDTHYGKAFALYMECGRGPHSEGVGRDALKWTKLAMLESQKKNITVVQVWLQHMSVGYLIILKIPCQIGIFQNILEDFRRFFIFHLQNCVLWRKYFIENFNISAKCWSWVVKVLLWVILT
jgi:hypothetical protein